MSYFGSYFGSYAGNYYGPTSFGGDVVPPPVDSVDVIGSGSSLFELNALFENERVFRVQQGSTILYRVNYGGMGDVTASMWSADRGEVVASAVQDGYAVALINASGVYTNTVNLDDGSTHVRHVIVIQECAPETRARNDYYGYGYY